MRVVFVGRVRPLAKRMALYPLTLGISRRVWLHRIDREVDGHEALGLHHAWGAALLASPALAIALAVSMLASGTGARAAIVAGAVLWFPSTVATALTARRVANMTEGTVAYGPWWLVWLATWVPILGHLFFIAWTQSRLNHYWPQAEGRGDGVDVDLDLEGNPEYAAELRDALRASYHAGSRFDRNRERRREQVDRVVDAWNDVRSERRRVRALGGSTPVLPWRRPQRPAVRRLHVRCPKGHAFEASRDPFSSTVVHCPTCGSNEVLPGLSDDPLAGRTKAAYAAVRATCPSCGQPFSAARNLHGATRLRCPSCGHEDELPAPTPA